MADKCEDCFRTKELEFQIGSLELCAKGMKQEQTNKDIEHESMIQNLGNRMDTMSQDFINFKAEIKEEVQSIKTEIPAMFDNAVNKLLASILRWALRLIAIIFVVAILVSILAFNRTSIVSGLDELKHRVETMEVTTP